MSILSILLVAVIFSSGCTTQTEEKVYRVGVLWTGGEFFVDLLDSFKEKMTELGYVEGENIVYDVYMAPNPVGNQQVVQKYVDQKVDMILSFATEATIEAKATAMGSGIPVVFTCTFIEGTALVESVSHPGGDITGVRYPTTESAAGRLEMLHVVAPDSKRILVPYLKDYPTTGSQIEVLKLIASELGLTLLEAPFASPQELTAYLEEREDSSDIGIDAIVMLADPFSVMPDFFGPVYGFADEHGLPISSAMISTEAYGPVIGFHPTNSKMGSMAAEHADKVLKGGHAGDIPVTTSDNDLRINYRLAQKLGLEVSDGLLSMAIEITR